MKNKSGISPSSQYHIVSFSLLREGWINLIGLSDKHLDDCWEELLNKFPDIQSLKIGSDFFVFRRSKTSKVFLSIRERKKRLESELLICDKQLKNVLKIMKNGV